MHDDFKLKNPFGLYISAPQELTIHQVAKVMIHTPNSLYNMHVGLQSKSPIGRLNLLLRNTCSILSVNHVQLKLIIPPSLLMHIQCYTYIIFSVTYIACRPIHSHLMSY